ncbi:bifunctional DNA-formamidopyrimidine glycosylase/DNA-(apurinic or apyrimidinic site) lyase [Chitinimonas lacunae]|uniref:Formamidopyrimidine-DNA glycosylase n=1 Tax=Chitinimonas lacunae TaxID=1963018 RepID=A0ABV8MSG3_9NEIS
MPELPEVETTRRGIAPSLLGKSLAGATVRESRLRWPVPPDLAALVAGRTVEAVGRRAKYLLFDLGTGHLILHLGMSGSLRFLHEAPPAVKHEHVDLLLSDSALLRYRDPRRFGAILWQPGPAELHPLLRDLGPEPLEAGFDGAYLEQALAGRRTAIKLAIMDARVVVGVGNIYANEALFRCGIAPQREAGELSRAECGQLADAIRLTLTESIAAGGSTLRDFVDSSGQPGYFQQHYFVYDRAGLPCHRCGQAISQTRLGQRSTYWCPYCQPQLSRK